MGGKQARFEEDTMNDFEATTALNRAEIYHAFKRFHLLYTDYEQSSSEALTPMLTTGGYINPDITLPIDFISENMAELMVNPFRKKMCAMFAVSQVENMSFVEFLDMVSAFSPKNNLQQRTFHAFQIFDVDQDGIISRNDMYDVLNMISDGTLTDAVKERVVDELFSEVHKEKSTDGLTTEDFHYAISRAPDFPSTFSFRI